ncbi:MAG: diphthine--ammonia ligase [Acidobacteria bacterium]|nr:diphthine--ammonia ligase [Acidobacteriota bacterium]
MKSVLVSWSGGKDSCMALDEILRTPETYQVAALLTTVARDEGRIGIHHVRRALLERQAAALGLPLLQVEIKKGATNDEYESALEMGIAPYRAQGVEEIVYGDLFLADIRAYREALLARLGMHGLFPVWGRDTSHFVRDFLARGFKAIVTSVNADALPASFAGCPLDEEFLARLPHGVDPCGERGEFHTYVYDGPLFREAIKFHIGETTLQDNHYCCDLLPPE